MRFVIAYLNFSWVGTAAITILVVVRSWPDPTLALLGGITLGVCMGIASVQWKKRR